MKRRAFLRVSPRHAPGRRWHCLPGVGTWASSGDVPGYNSAASGEKRVAGRQDRSHTAARCRTRRRPRWRRSRSTLDQVVGAFSRGRHGREEIALRFSILDLADDYATVAYYLNHREAGRPVRRRAGGAGGGPAPQTRAAARRGSAAGASPGAARSRLSWSCCVSPPTRTSTRACCTARAAPNDILTITAFAAEWMAKRGPMTELGREARMRALSASLPGRILLREVAVR